MTSLRLGVRNSLPPAHWIWTAGAAVSAVAIGALAGRHPFTALLILVFAAGTYATIARPFYGALGLAILTPISAATKRGWLVPHLRLNEALIIWIAPLVILTARRPVRGWGRLEWLGLAYALATLLLGGFDLWRRGAPFNSTNVGTLVGPLQYLLLLRALRVSVHTERQVSQVLRAVLLTAVPVCLLGLMQGFGVTWAQSFAHNITGIDEGHLNRAVGVFTNWQVFAGYLLAVGLLAVATLAYGATEILRPRVAAGVAVLIGLALARTLTIGALAGWLVASGGLLVMSGRIRMSARRALSAVGTALAAVAVVLAARYHQEFVPRPGQLSNGIVPNTVMDRIHNWTREYLPALSGRWVTGYGPDTPANATWKFTDSVYVTIVLRGGLILLGLYTALMVGFASVCQGLGGRGPVMAAASAALFVLVVVLVPLQTLATYFTTSGLPEVIWMLAAVVSLGSLKGSRDHAV